MRTLSAVLLALLSSGCVLPKQYTVPPKDLTQLGAERTAGSDLRYSIRSCPVLSARETDPRVDTLCRLSIIEFDGQGEFWEPAQLDRTLDLLHSTSRPGRSALVVVFIHGWHNDASPRNERRGNLASFNEALLDLAEDGLRQCDSGYLSACGRPVVGVYMAWRGESLRTPLGKTLSYFPRRATAERVARVSFSHALHRIVNHAKGNQSEDENGKRTRGNEDSIVVVIGHSLGGLILENTLLRSLTHETNNFRETFPVDLAVLVNSANDSIITKQFVQALENGPPAPDPENRLSLPLIVSVASEGDWATRYLTPVSQALRQSWKFFRPYEPPVGNGQHGQQRFFYRHTAPHTGPGAGLVSHRILCPEEERGCGAVTRSRRTSRRELSGELRPKRELFDPPVIKVKPCTREKDQESSLQCVESLWFTGASSEVLYEVQRLPDARNDTFFWVLRLPRRIVPDHSRFFQSEFISLVAALVNLRWSPQAESLAEAKELLFATPGGDDATELSAERVATKPGQPRLP